jgi:hypothetical protein
MPTCLFVFLFVRSNALKVHGFVFLKKHAVCQRAILGQKKNDLHTPSSSPFSQTLQPARLLNKQNFARKF